MAGDPWAEFRVNPPQNEKGDPWAEFRAKSEPSSGATQGGPEMMPLESGEVAYFDPKKQAQYETGKVEGAKGFASGAAQSVTDIGALLPFSWAKKPSEYLKTVGSPEAQTLGETAAIVAPLVGPAAKAIGAGGQAVKSLASGLSPEKLATSLFGEAGTASSVGKNISETVLGRLEDLVSSRRDAAKEAFKKYFEQARPYEQKIANDYAQSLKRFTDMNKKDLSADELKLINDSIGRLGGKGEAGIGRLEKERRKLNEIAKGIDEEGYSAIRQQRAQSLADHLTGVIGKYSDASKDALKVYQEASEPINQFAKSIGAKVTAKAGEFLPDVPKVDVDKLPAAFFRSEQSIKDLKALSGSEEFASKAAREHVASELAGMPKKTAENIDSYIRKNRDWLKEVPDVMGDLEQYQKRLSQAGAAKKAAKGTAYVGGALAGGAELKKALGL